MEFNAPAIVLGHALALIVAYVFVAARKKPSSLSLPMHHAKAYTDSAAIPVTVVPTCLQQVWTPYKKAHAE